MNLLNYKTFIMQGWINFWNLLFWLSITGFLINLENLFKILIYSELVWIILYTYTVLIASINNDLNILSTSFYILAIAGLEFSVGIILIVFFKNNIKSISVENENKNEKIFNKQKNFLNKMYWNFK